MSSRTIGKQRIHQIILLLQFLVLIHGLILAIFKNDNVLFFTHWQVLGFSGFIFNNSHKSDAIYSLKYAYFSLILTVKDDIWTSLALQTATSLLTGAQASCGLPRFAKQHGDTPSSYWQPRSLFFFPTSFTACKSYSTWEICRLTSSSEALKDSHGSRSRPQADGPTTADRRSCTAATWTDVEAFPTQIVQVNVVLKGKFAAFMWDRGEDSCCCCVEIRS